MLEFAQTLGLFQGELRRMIELPEASFVLRAECCHLIDALYIDVEPHRTLPGMMQVCTWSNMNLHHQYGGRREASGDAVLPEDVEQEKWKHLDVEALKATVSKEVGQLHRSAGGGAPRGSATVFREQFFGGMVQLVTELLRFGFYHKAPDADPQCGFWPSVDIKELKWIGVALFEAMNTSLEPLRRDSLAAKQSSLGARHVDMVFDNANAVLSLMMQLLECGMHHQVPALHTPHSLSAIARSRY